jgi:hypothetical protein
MRKMVKSFPERRYLLHRPDAVRINIPTNLLTQGISLPIDQFSSLVTLLPEIEIALQEKGLSIPRPNYIDQGTNTGGNDKKDSTDGLPMARPSRENIEATSDEDENEE